MKTKNILKFITAIRTTENEVKALYVHREYSQEFFVNWCNINQDGELGDYHLEVGCMSNSESLNELIRNAIRNGESNDKTCLLYRELIPKMLSDIRD